MICGKRPTPIYDIPMDFRWVYKNSRCCCVKHFEQVITTFQPESYNLNKVNLNKHNVQLLMKHEYNHWVETYEYKGWPFLEDDGGWENIVKGDSFTNEIIDFSNEDVLLVMNQTSCTRQNAILALHDARSDIIEAIVSLTT